jgi:hypothetical protein
MSSGGQETDPDLFPVCSAVEASVAGACGIAISWHPAARYWLHASTQAGNLAMLAVPVIGGTPIVVKLGVWRLQIAVRHVLAQSYR